MRERFGDSYIELKCGHYTTRSAQEAYRDYAKRGRYMCEQCGKYSSRVAKPKREPLPDKPPF